MDLEAFGGTEGATRNPTWESLKFNGDGAEFFGIWIVNLFLTILTFGIYAAWAKVRTNQYFYANTEYKGGTLEYLADPVKILIGNLIIVAFVGIYLFSGYLVPAIGVVVILAFGLFYPFLIYKTLRFRARHTAYRNIRFKFSGKCGKAYTLYMGYMILNALSGGLLFPYVAYRQKGYHYNNLHYGNADGQFKGDVGFFYKAYGIAFVVSLLLFIAGVVLVMVLLMGLGIAFPELVENPENEVVAGIVLATIGIGIYLGFLFISTLFPLYIFKEITNHTMERFTLGPFHFRSHLEFKKLLMIRLTNTSLIVLTLGLYTPWAKVRRYKYIAECIEMLSEERDFDEISAADMRGEVESVGEAAADIFDFDIGFGL